MRSLMWRDRAIRLAREVSWVAGGQLLALVATVALTKVLTMRLGPEEYGRMALAITVAVLLNQIVFGPLIVSAQRYLGAYTERRLVSTMLAVVNQAVRWIIMIVVLIAVAIGGVVLALGGDTMWPALLTLGLAFGVVQNVYSLYNALQAARRRRANAALHQAIDPLARLLGAALLMGWLGPSAIGALFGSFVGMLVVLISQQSAFLRGISADDHDVPREHDAVASELTNYGKYYALWGPFSWAFVASDRWAIHSFRDDAAVGIYTAAFQIASIPSVLIAGVLAGFFVPIIFQRAGDASDRARRESALTAIRIAVVTMIALVVVSALAVALVAEPLLVQLTSDAFRPSAPYLPALVIGLGLLQVGYMLALVPITLNEMRGYTMLRIAHSVGAATLNVASAWLFGVAGVCAALIISGLSFVIAVAWGNRRILARPRVDVPR